MNSTLFMATGFPLFILVCMGLAKSGKFPSKDGMVASTITNSMVAKVCGLAIYCILLTQTIYPNLPQSCGPSFLGYMFLGIFCAYLTLEALLHTAHSSITPFANTFGYMVAAMSLGKKMAPPQPSDGPSGDYARALARVYMDPMPLLNILKMSDVIADSNDTTDSTTDPWTQYAEPLIGGVYEKDAVVKFLWIKNVVGRGIWYILVAMLTASIADNNATISDNCNSKEKL